MSNLFELKVKPRADELQRFADETVIAHLDTVVRHKLSAMVKIELADRMDAVIQKALESQEMQDMVADLILSKTPQALMEHIQKAHARLDVAARTIAKAKFQHAP